jgi:fructose transport system substrate-binding protein
MRSTFGLVRAVAATLFILVSMLLPGTPGATAAPAKIVIGYIVKTLTNPFFVAMRPVAEAEAAKVGATLVYAAGKYDGDNATQVSIVDDLITRKAGAIIVIPNLSSGIVPAVRRATAKGIAVLAIDTATDPPDAVTSFIATDNYEAGILNGLWARKAMVGQKPVIALLEGTPGSEVNTDRMDGFLNGFDLNAKKYVVSDLVTNGDQGKGQTTMENALTAHPDINLVWTVNEPAALGAATAIKAHGMAGKIRIVSMDGGCRGINAVRDGVIDTDVMQFPRMMAKLGVDYAFQAAQGKKIPARIDTGEILVTQDKTAQQYVPSNPVSFGLKNCW